MTIFELNIIEFILALSLIIALICSIIIYFNVLILKNRLFYNRFSSWQMPMIFAMLGDIYLMK